MFWVSLWQNEENFGGRNRDNMPHLYGQGKLVEIFCEKMSETGSGTALQKRQAV